MRLLQSKLLLIISPTRNERVKYLTFFDHGCNLHKDTTNLSCIHQSRMKSLHKQSFLREPKLVVTNKENTNYTCPKPTPLQLQLINSIIVTRGFKLTF